MLNVAYSSTVRLVGTVSVSVIVLLLKDATDVVLLKIVIV